MGSNTSFEVSLGYPLSEFENGVSPSENRGRPGHAGVHPNQRRPRMAERTKELTEMASREDGGGGASRGSGRKAKGILLPAAATAAAAAAAGLAAKKAPDLMKKLRGEADEEAEELGRKGAEGAKRELGARGGLAGKAASKLLGGGGDAGQKGGK